MCGIAGYITYKGPADQSIVDLMVSQMVKRGPDYQDKATIRNATFGHARLSIIDLSSMSNQPRIDSTGRFMISFNGEIYNYKSIKDELTRSYGIHFNSDGDTEVILEGYKQWGTGVLDRLNGMFAFAIWDDVDQSLFIARDRFGKKPLYYSAKDECFAFASTLSALGKHPSVTNTLNIASIRQYLSLNYTTTNTCILNGVSKLEPASYIVVRQDRSILKKRYWNYSACFYDKKPVHDIGLLYDEIYELIRDSVKIRMEADVPVCAFLSGGIDSSLVATAVIEDFGDIDTYTLGFNNTAFDESSEAKIFANYHGIRNTTVYSDSSIYDSFTNAVSSIDEPFADSSFIPLAELSSKSSKDYKVSLVGDGGDEIFAGYETYNADIVAKYFHYVPPSVTKFIAFMADKLLPHSFGKVSVDEKIRRLLNGIGRGQQWAHYQWRIIFNDNDLKKLLNPDFHHLITDFSPFNDYLNFYKDVKGLDIIDQSLYVDSKTWLVDDILYKSDRASMMHSQELRCPFLDFRIAERAAQIPASDKMQLFKLKKVLKGIASQKIPSEYIQRRKRGFNSPLFEWLSGPLQITFQEMIHDSNMKQFFNVKYLKVLMNDLVNGNADNSYKIYGVLVLFAWIKHNKYSLEV